MQRIIQINIAGRMIPIEEDAYVTLRQYLESLERHFANEEGKAEIMQDMEYRIAELFTIRLEAGNPCIDREDVQKVTETLGSPHKIGAETAEKSNPYSPVTYQKSHQYYNTNDRYDRRLYRNPKDKMLGGVCSGLAVYFDVDPVIIRLIMVVLLLGAGIGVLAYVIAWVIIPIARTPEEMASMTGGDPMNFESLKRNVTEELNDLRKRTDDLTNELRDFFSKKK
jgi:phage shock protein C